VILLGHDDVAGMRNAWIGGAFLAAGSAMICLGFVNLFINPELPE